MPTENNPVEHSFDLSTPDGGRGYIANLFKTVLKRHDYRQYIAVRLAGDFACTLAEYLKRITAERDALQLRLNAADQRIDELTRPATTATGTVVGGDCSLNTITVQILGDVPSKLWTMSEPVTLTHGHSAKQ